MQTMANQPLTSHPQLAIAGSQRQSAIWSNRCVVELKLSTRLSQAKRSFRGGYETESSETETTKFEAVLTLGQRPIIILLYFYCTP